MRINLFQLIEKIPNSPGIYLFKNAQGKVLYIGKALNLKKRLKFYQNQQNLDQKMRQMVKETVSLEIIKTSSEFEALILEVNLIKKFKPKYNTLWKDDKRQLYIKISADQLPRVTLSRIKQEKKASYFGPFPSAQKTKQVLKILRRISPFCSCTLRRKKPCLFVDLGLCGIKNPKKYRQDIANLKIALRGKIKNLIKKLKKQMKKEAERENFEEAVTLREKIKKLEYLLEPRSIASYLDLPKLREQIQKQELEDLKKILRISSLERIEGYDISNLAGQKATGSMVVFYHGFPDKESYRQFRLRQSKRDDPRMLSEVLQRRLRHFEWDFPDLIVIDGGKTQLSAVKKVLKKLALKIPFLGIVKGEEKIVLATKKGFAEYRLSSDSAGLQLIQRVRDEAHRFAKRYHLKLREKVLTKVS